MQILKCFVHVATNPCADPECFFFREGPFLTFVILIDEGIQIPFKAGHHRPASKMPFKWHFAGGRMMAQHRMQVWGLCDFQEIRASIAKKSFIFVFFREVGSGTPAPPLDTCMGSKIN